MLIKINEAQEGRLADLPGNGGHIESVIDVVLSGGHRNREQQLLSVRMLLFVLIEGGSELLCWFDVAGRCGLV